MSRVDWDVLVFVVALLGVATSVTLYIIKDRRAKAKK